MTSIEQLQNIVNRFDQLNPAQKTEAINCFQAVIDKISNEEVKAFFTELLNFLKDS